MDIGFGSLFYVTLIKDGRGYVNKADGWHVCRTSRVQVMKGDK